MHKFLILIFIFSISFSNVLAQNKVAEAKAALDSAGITEKDVNTALKETLDESADEASEYLAKKRSLGSNDIFGLNIPSELKLIAQILSQNGDSNLIINLENEINKLIPDLISEIKPVFDSNINQIDFKNAYAILMGDKNAATEYLKAEKSDDIKKAVGPIIQRLLTSTGVLDKWQMIISQFNKLTGQNMNFNLVEYVSNQIVDDIFNKMGEEEKKIRFNQFFWTTTIMRTIMEIQHKVVR